MVLGIFILQAFENLMFASSCGNEGIMSYDSRPLLKNILV
jgi:hypothetical protein